LQDIVVPKPQDFPSKAVQICRSFAIGLMAMLPAISFDDQSALGAGEIRDATANRLLPAELEAAELAIADPIPQPPFGVGCLTSEPPRVRVDSPDGRHRGFLEEGKPSPNPLPHAGEG
jgi:hypothetical protein